MKVGFTHKPKCVVPNKEVENKEIKLDKLAPKMNVLEVDTVEFKGKK